MVDRIGQQLGNYRLVRLLGQGGFADVYLGEHIHLNTQAAIKMLRTQLASDDITHFRNEARTIAHLVHPNIVQVLDFGVEGNTPFLVMAYAPNGTLRQRHPRGIPLPPLEVLSHVKQVASALQYAHDQRLIHRDIKPENMLLGRSNEVLLSDFGIALVTQSVRAQSLISGSLRDQSTIDPAGTVAYMAPEQISGKPSPASDQYALGVIVYEWLCGVLPFNGAYMEIAMQHMSAAPPSLRQKAPSISPELERVVLTALAKEPQQRFPSVQAFADALEEVCQVYANSSHLSFFSTVFAGGGAAMEASLYGPSGRTALGSNVITIGRKPDNQLVIQDPKTSSHHAVIRPEKQGHSIVDLGSTNGTFVNEQLLEPGRPRLLGRGDTIRIGDTRFIYEPVASAVQSSNLVSDGPTQRADSGYPGSVVSAPPPPFTTGYGGNQPQSYQPPVPSAYPGQALNTPGAPGFSGPMPPVPSMGAGGFQTPIRLSNQGGVPGSATPVLPSGDYMGFTGIPTAPTPTPAPTKPGRRKLWIILGSAGLVLLIVLATSGVLLYMNSLPTPAKALAAFCTSLQSKDAQAAYNDLSSRFQNKTPESLFASFFASVTSCTPGSPTQAGNTATATLSTISAVHADNDHVTLVQDSNNAWKIDDVANLSGLTRTLDTYCGALQSGDYATAYGQLSTKLQGKLTETQFSSFFPKASACSYGSLAFAASGATITITTATASGQTVNDPVSLAQDSSNGWKIDDFASLPDKTLDTFCSALQQKDYPTAYNQLSTALQGGFPESQFAQTFSVVTSCTHDPAMASNSNITSNLTLGGNSGQTLIFTAYVIRDSTTSKWKIDNLVNLPNQTLDTFCTALNNKDYAAAYNELSTAAQQTLTEQQFAQGFSSVTSCTHDFPVQSGTTATANIVLVLNNGQTVHGKATLVEQSPGDWKINSIQQV